MPRNPLSPESCWRTFGTLKGIVQYHTKDKCVSEHAVAAVPQKGYIVGRHEWQQIKCADKAKGCWYHDQQHHGQGKFSFFLVLDCFDVLKTDMKKENKEACNGNNSGISEQPADDLKNESIVRIGKDDIKLPRRGWLSISGKSISKPPASLDVIDGKHGLVAASGWIPLIKES